MTRGHIINSDLCLHTLKTLQERFRIVRYHKYISEILLQLDNARPHTSFKTQVAITKLRLTVLPHPPYSPDLVPSDLHLFGALKVAIRTNGFANNDEVVEEVRSGCEC
jgi:histone-lysine N-methyltransferase SETMAR